MGSQVLKSHLSNYVSMQHLCLLLAYSPVTCDLSSRAPPAGARRVQVLSYSEISGSTAQIETMGVVNGAYAGAA